MKKNVRKRKAKKHVNVSVVMYVGQSGVPECHGITSDKVEKQELMAELTSHGLYPYQVTRRLYL